MKRSISTKLKKVFPIICPGQSSKTHQYLFLFNTSKNSKLGKQFIFKYKQKWGYLSLVLSLIAGLRLSHDLAWNYCLIGCWAGLGSWRRLSPCLSSMKRLCRSPVCALTAQAVSLYPSSESPFSVLCQSGRAWVRTRLSQTWVSGDKWGQ